MNEYQKRAMQTCLPESDNLIRLSALRSGVLRCSSGEFIHQLEWTLGQMAELLEKTNQNAHKTRVKDGKQ